MDGFLTALALFPRPNHVIQQPASPLVTVCRFYILHLKNGHHDLQTEKASLQLIEDR